MRLQFFPCLFPDRVGRHQSPCPLRQRGQINTPFSEPRGKRHFYSALAKPVLRLTWARDWRSILQRCMQFGKPKPAGLETIC
jgi:hypothetical protein